MRTETILITGASGYLGLALAHCLSQQGYSVMSMGRKKIVVAGISGHIQWEFNQKQIASLREVTTLIHCAWNMSLTDSFANEAENVNGTKLLIEQAISQGIQKIIFISTTSAFSGAKTVYGASKFALEEWGRARNVMIVRPGLLYGSTGGSMFGALKKIVTRVPVVPVFGASKLFFTSEIDDITSAIAHLVEHPELYSAKLPVFANPEPVRFIDILKSIALAEQKKRYFVPVPWWPVYRLLKLCEFFKIALPFKSDSLLSLMTLPSKQPVNPSFKFRSFLNQ
jgi:nucleoside-diphosphate-sugar epimerase